MYELFFKRLKNAYIHYVSRRIRKFKIENRVLRPSSEIVTEAARLVNTLIEIGEVSNACYLEIGVEYGYTFANVSSKTKYAVDPNLRFNKILKPKSWKLYEVTSDEFFSTIDKSTKFDFIFLDGLHTSRQTYNDLRNSLSHLKRNSVVIIDDTVPCDEFSAIPNQELSYKLRSEFGNPGDGSWHGDVFRVIVALNLLDNFDFELATISDLENPKTILWLGPEGNWPKDLPAMPEVNAKYSDYFSEGIIHKYFNPITEERFYEIFRSEKKSQ